MQRTEKVAQSVARGIAHDIAARKLPEGAMLPAEALMRVSHRVSRATLREALRLLEVQGLITIKPGRGGGPVVRRVDAGDFGRNSTLHFLVRGATFAELVRARLALEPVLAGLAAENRDQSDVTALRSFIDQEEASPLSQDAKGDHVPGAGFHEAIVAMSGNAVLEIYASALAAIFQARVAKGTYPPEARDRVETHHRIIAEAVIAGDAGAAEAQMRQHMTEFVEFWKAQYPGLLNEVVDWA